VTYYKKTEKAKLRERQHEARMARPLARLREEVEEAEKKYNAAGEPEVVFGKQLAEVLNTWREEWLKKRDYEKEQRVMGPLDWLKEMTGLHARRIYGLMQAENPYVSLTQAELILMVIDREYLLSNGTIRVVPNPNWSPEKWLAYMEERGC
jgi:hypothetical protein